MLKIGVVEDLCYVLKQKVMKDDWRLELSQDTFEGI